MTWDELNWPALDRPRDGLGPAVDVELLVDRVGVELDRPLGDEQLGRDLLVPQPLRHQPQDIQFARGQLVFLVLAAHDAANV